LAVGPGGKDHAGSGTAGSRALREFGVAVEILYLLVPLSVVMVFAIGALFWWAVRSGQFDDMEGPAHRILMDDDSPVAHAKSGSRAKRPG
jgi:cbb3-type cytochrome oxidase maturation protein